MVGAGQASDTKILVLGRWVENRHHKMLISLRWQKIELFPGWEKNVGCREQPLDSQTTDPPDIVDAVIYIHWPCPTGDGLAVG